MKDFTFLLVAAISGAMILGSAVWLIRRFESKVPRDSSQEPERFARLLLAEIRLYAGKKVDDAWSRRAVYGELKGDIDRAREMYLRRFPTSEPVFYDALISVLARGDAGRLGNDYPYARARSSTKPGEASVNKTV
jgi:hypothetical protein